MHLTVLLFGPEAAIAGRESVPVEVGPDATTQSLLRSLGRQWPTLAPSLRSARLAINHSFAAPNQPIRPTDELALIGPVSGG